MTSIPPPGRGVDRNTAFPGHHLHLSWRSGEPVTGRTCFLLHVYHSCLIPPSSLTLSLPSSLPSFLPSLHEDDGPSLGLSSEPQTPLSQGCGFRERGRQQTEINGWSGPHGQVRCSGWQRRAKKDCNMVTEVDSTGGSDISSVRALEG